VGKRGRAERDREWDGFLGCNGMDIGNGHESSSPSYGSDGLGIAVGTRLWKNIHTRDVDTYRLHAHGSRTQIDSFPLGIRLYNNPSTKVVWVCLASLFLSFLLYTLFNSVYFVLQLVI
jgi:hypothetical protein